MASLEILAFLGLVIAISFSGVLQPGPMTAATIVKSYSDRWAGVKVAIGHGIVEMPLLAVIAIGSTVLVEEHTGVILLIGLVGGTYLLLLGIKILRDKGFIEEDPKKEKISTHSFTLGIITTLFNPGFVVWWLTIGIFFVTQALEYGILILIIFGIVHWMTDFIWGVAISFGIQKVKEFYASRAKEIIRYVCAAMILVFGGYFAISSAYGLLTG